MRVSVLCAAAAGVLLVTGVGAAHAETYAECVARVKKDYPVPPGNINAQKQMIEQECGDLQKKETKK
jgi:hypothetical protein